MKKTAAPALERGIQILQELEREGPLSLDQLTQRIPIPKSSALRFLGVLLELGLVARDDARKHYTARVAFVPIQGHQPHEKVKRQKAMQDLARRTGRTVEWYVVGEIGMVLVERAEPERTEVRIGANVGFIRGWTQELEAVICLGYGWAGDAAPRPGKLWAYREHGVRGFLSMKEIRARIEEGLHAGFVRDPIYNTNGVRRAASVVLRVTGLDGVLALAEHVSQESQGHPSELLSQLRQTAEHLGDKPLPNLKEIPSPR